jgi:hypothetical protein
MPKNTRHNGASVYVDVPPTPPAEAVDAAVEPEVQEGEVLNTTASAGIADAAVEVSDSVTVPPIADTDPDADPAGQLPPRPAGNASKADWLDYLLALGLEVEGGADDHTRDELIALADATEVN